MSGAQMLIAVGRAEGEAKGKAEVLLKILSTKFGTPAEAVVTLVQSASTMELDYWLDCALRAQSIDAVFDS